MTYATFVCQIADIRDFWFFALQHLTARFTLVSSSSMNSAFTLVNQYTGAALRPGGACQFTTTTIITVTTSPVRPVVFA